MAFVAQSVKIVLFQKDYFVRSRRVSSNIRLLTRNGLHYLPVKDVLEILEYDILRSNKTSFSITDGSELITLPRNGSLVRREATTFRIDPVVWFQKCRFLSLRSINRIFNVDTILNLKAKRVCIRQPGRMFITLAGDTLRSLSRLLNTTTVRLKAVNRNLREPIPSGTKVIIPMIPFDPMDTARPSSRSRAKIKQEPELAPAIIKLGSSLRGTPYKFGAAPYPASKRFDCSSYLQYIFGKNGVRLPRTSRTQARRGRSLTRSEIEPGDLIFFRRDRYSDNRVGHVGMDIGNGKMLNTYKSPPGVTVTTWRRPYWLNRYITAREIL
ncbi:hydrolase [Paenibacillus darwinianus]|uniref:Hydrolase n=1 Tax=Paenibacillus darwinianus TaxID=1380763 RepID=A0A9W5S1V1_9BACL|nr:C40 family peptidase [Paenibacillus darwinianus]EXX88809.1 hydrolase [Paenibacillus darwinianus]EXX89150.1 hydrolase [Paenibacillus darwinianus]EXX90487.1 hydrolase [Paenibacillus darwinianus]